MLTIKLGKGLMFPLNVFLSSYKLISIQQSGKLSKFIYSSTFLEYFNFMLLCIYTSLHFGEICCTFDSTVHFVMHCNYMVNGLAFI